MTAKYETIVVLRPELTDGQVKDEQKKLETLISNEGGKISSVDYWGKKDIAYIVRKNKSGHFLCINFESDKSDTVKNTQSILRITEAVIKFQTHRKAEKVRKFKGNPKRRITSDTDDLMDSGDDNY